MTSAPEQLTMWGVGANPEQQAQWARCILATDSHLLAPLRDAVDRAQKEARAALAEMDDDCNGTMGWDSCADAIDLLEPCWLHNCRNELKENLWNAEGALEGYDTWNRAALAAHVKQLRRLLAALTHLVGILDHLSRREAEELSALTMKTTENVTPAAEPDTSAAVITEADKLEELIQLKLENPGMTRENALKWALEMKRVYAPKACVHGIAENRVCLSCSPWRRMWQ